MEQSIIHIENLKCEFKIGTETGFLIIIFKVLSLKSAIFLNEMFSVEFSMETFSLLPFRISLQLYLKFKNALKNYRS